MLYNIKTNVIINKLALTLCCLFFLDCCRGFYEPVTLNTKIPDGPPEFQSGFRSGCRSGLATRAFSNAQMYNPDFGSGVYQHDSAYADGWSMGWFACVIHQATFTSAPNFYPLE